MSKQAGTMLIAPGLGSCIGLIMYDSITKVERNGSYIVLPDSSINKGELNPCKYADSAVPELLCRVTQAGAKKPNLIVKMAGGAQMFNLEKGGNILNIGVRNCLSPQKSGFKQRRTYC
ncbi:MAG: hypothetical protein MZU97_26880 [Bacillus subtilis]|nr:hypothetical protein [Bacillus subtilis]